MRTVLATMIGLAMGCAGTDLDRATECTIERICTGHGTQYTCGSSAGLDPEQRCCGAVGNIVAKVCDAAGRCYMFSNTCVPYGFQYPWPDARVSDSTGSPDGRPAGFRWDSFPGARRDTRPPAPRDASAE